VALRYREVENLSTGIEKSRKVEPSSGERLARKARVATGTRREVGEHCSASRDRGSMQTKDAVGRHRRKAIESSVVRLTTAVRTPVREEADWMEIGESRGKFSRT